jgi:hypothetical protein
MPAVPQSNFRMGRYHPTTEIRGAWRGHSGSAVCRMKIKQRPLIIRRAAHTERAVDRPNQNTWLHGEWLTQVSSAPCQGHEVHRPEPARFSR